VPRRGRLARGRRQHWLLRRLHARLTRPTSRSTRRIAAGRHAAVRSFRLQKAGPYHSARRP